MRTTQIEEAEWLSYGTGTRGKWKLDDDDSALKHHHSSIVDNFLTPFSATDPPPCYMERRCRYFRFYVDLDLKPEAIFDPLRDAFDRSIEKLLDVLIETLDEFTERVSHSYIFTAKPVYPSGIHLYFPGLIVDADFALATRKRVLEKLSGDPLIPDPLWKKVYDESVYHTGLRMPYCRLKTKDNVYIVDRERSTDRRVTLNRPEKKQFLNDLALTRFRTEETEMNFAPKLDDTGIPVYFAYRPAPKPKKQRITKKVVRSGSVESLELEIPIEMFRELSENLGPKLTQYRGWLHWVFVCRTYGLYQLAVEMSDAKGPEVINPIFNKPLPDSPLTVSSLFKWSAEHDLKRHRRIVQQHLELRLTHSDELLLRNVPAPDLTENCRYISDQSVDRMKSDPRNCYLIHSGTGTGKTTCLSRLIAPNDDTSIVSLVSRRTMVATHQSAFEEWGLGSYLVDGQSDRFIVSLESLIHQSKLVYDVVLLDEIDSVLRHLFSPTLEGRRIKVFRRLVSMVVAAKTVVGCDATLTAASYIFLSELRSDLLYFRNSYPNRRGCELRVHRGHLSDEERIESMIRGLCKKLEFPDPKLVKCLRAALKRLSSDDFHRRNRAATIMRLISQKRLLKYKTVAEWTAAFEQLADCRWAGWLTETEKLRRVAERVIEARKTNRSQLIVSDSKRIVHQMRQALIDLGHPPEDILMVTGEIGSIEELKRANTMFKEKTLICSPRIVYGIDMTIGYGPTFAIYRGSTIGSLEMLQQMSRARCSTIQELTYLPNVTRPNYRVDYDYLVAEEQKRIEAVDREHPEVEGMLEVCCRFDGGFQILDTDSLFTKLYLVNRYIEKSTEQNKIDLLLLLAKEQGWKITDLPIELPKSSEPLPDKIEQLDRFLEEEFAKVVSGNRFVDPPTSKPPKVKASKKKPDGDYVRKPLFPEPTKKKKPVKKPDKKPVRKKKLDSSIISRIDIDVREAIGRRLTVLGKSWEEFEGDQALQLVVRTQKAFERYLDGQLLFMTPAQLALFKMQVRQTNPKSSAKENRRLLKLAAIEALEAALGIETRFQIDQLEVDVEQAKTELLKIVDQLAVLQEGQAGMVRIKTRLRVQIDGLNFEDQVRRFVMMTYNRVDRFIKCDSQRFKCRQSNIDRKMYNGFRFEPPKGLYPTKIEETEVENV